MPGRPRVAQLERLLRALRATETEFIVVGGMAMISHGSARLTYDLDILYCRTPENLERVVAALRPLHPTLRGAPGDLPFLFDARALRAGLNFTFDTDAGPIDILGEVEGVGRYEDALPTAEEYEIYGRATKVLSLDLLIRAKESAARGKDLAGLDELRELRRLRDEGAR